MSTGIMKVFLLLAVVVCISQAQQSPQESQRCLCLRVRRLVVSEVKDIQIYPATSFCNRMEIVVTTNSGYRYCLNPIVQQLVANILKRLKASTATPTTPGNVAAV